MKLPLIVIQRLKKIAFEIDCNNKAMANQKMALHEADKIREDTIRRESEYWDDFVNFMRSNQNT